MFPRDVYTRHACDRGFFLISFQHASAIQIWLSVLFERILETLKENHSKAACGRFLIAISTATPVKVKVYFLRILSAMIRVAAAKMPQTMPMKKALTGS
jgi:hypothetical protein